MSSTRSTNPSRFEFKGFLNIDLDEKDKQDFEYWGKAEVEDVDAALGNLIAGMYKIGISWNDWEGLYQFAATCKNPDSKYYGHCIVITHEHRCQGLIVLGHLYEQVLKPEKLILGNEQIAIPL